MNPKPTLRLLAVAGLGALAASPAAAVNRDLPYETELAACVAAINAEVDVANASRVRHVLVESQSSSIGYELTIATTVYDADRSRAYRAECLARGRIAPIRLDISPRRS